MSTLVKFSARDFRRGVDDALTLAPIRNAVREMTSKHMGKKHPSAKSKRSMAEYDKKPSRRT